MDTKIAQRFDARAGLYDNPLTAYIGKQELRQIRKLVPEKCCVLDYGCGTGRTTLDLLERGCNVTAYDISAKMMAIARIKSQKKGWIAEFIDDASHLAGRTWPIVTCIGVLDYYPNPIPYLRILRQFVDPRGRIVVTFPNALSPFSWLYWLSSRVTIPAIPRTPESAFQAVQQAGLQVTDLLYAFPSRASLGFTLVMSLSVGERG